MSDAKHKRLTRVLSISVALMACVVAVGYWCIADSLEHVELLSHQALLLENKIWQKHDGAVLLIKTQAQTNTSGTSSQFSSHEETTAHEIRFDFPDDYTAGQLYAWQPSGKCVVKDARHACRVPMQSRIVYSTEIIDLYERTWPRFRNNELSGIIVTPSQGLADMCDGDTALANLLWCVGVVGGDF